MQSRTGGFRNWLCAVKVHLCRLLSVNSFSGAVVSPVAVPVSFCALTGFVSEKTHFPLSAGALRARQNVNVNGCLTDFDKLRFVLKTFLCELMFI